MMIITGLILWFLLGFLAFLIEAKKERCIRFDNEAKTELRFCTILGAIALLIVLYIAYIKPIFQKTNERFDDFMNDILLNINQENKGGR